MPILRALGLLLAAAAAVGGALVLLRRRSRGIAPEEGGPPGSQELRAELRHRVGEARSTQSVEAFERLDLGAIAAAAEEIPAGVEAIPTVERRLGPVPELYRPLVEQLARAKGRGAKALAGRSLDDLAARASELRAEHGRVQDVADALARELYAGQRIPRSVRSAAETAAALAATRVSEGLPAE